MKLAQWLLIALMGVTVSCGGSEGGATSGGRDEDDAAGDDGAGEDEDDDDDDKPSPRSPGQTARPGQGDGPSTKDAGAPSMPKENICDSLPLLVQPNGPEILIVLDRSASMVTPPVDRWTPSVNAVKKVTGELTETVKFGLMLFPAPSDNGGANGLAITEAILTGILGGGMMMPDPANSIACTPGKINVPTKTSSAQMIAQILDRSAPDIGYTPTAKTLEAALTSLDVPACPDCKTSPKYVLLVTDGQPTCGAAGTMTTPEDIAATHAAIDKLTEAGIKTYVVGYGIDAAVAPTMDEFAVHGGTEKYIPVEDEQTLVNELTRITGALVPCEYELEMPIEKPEYVRVRIDDTDYKYGEDWDVDGQKIILHVDAAACSTLRDAKIHDLKITKECEPVTVF